LKEVTEIILDEINEINKILGMQRIAFDSIISKNPRTRYLGNPLSFENKVLKLNTQMYYENIPLKEMNSETEIKIYTNSRKEKILCSGIIKSKYYIKSKENDWKLEKQIDNESYDLLRVQIKLNEAERKAFELGEIPLSMDDKLFMYCSKDEFHYYNSWTGVEIFKGKLERSRTTKNEWKIKEIQSSKERKCNIDEKTNQITNLIKHGIKRKMKLFE